MVTVVSKIQNYRVAFSIAPPNDPRFTVDDIPDLTGRVAIVTGGNRGCGLITAQVSWRTNVALKAGLNVPYLLIC